MIRTPKKGIKKGQVMNLTPWEYDQLNACLIFWAPPMPFG